MDMRMKPTLLAMAIAATLSACAIGPDYQRPAMDLPSSYAAAPPQAVAALAAPAWWSRFNDPVLDRVMDEALKNNLDLKVAAARVTEAQAQLGLAISDQVPSVYVAGSR